MKSIFTAALALVIIFCFAVLPANADKKILVGISKIVAHPALDALEKGVQEGIMETFPTMTMLYSVNIRILSNRANLPLFEKQKGKCPVMIKLENITKTFAAGSIRGLNGPESA